jgi:hypothetical protein
MSDSIMNDSIIQEVRTIREQHAARFDYDLDRIFADLKIRQEQYVAEGWVIISPPSTPPDPKTTLQQIRFTDR